MKVQIVNPYRVSHLRRYGVTVRGNVTSVCLTFRVKAFHCFHCCGYINNRGLLSQSNAFNPV
jgi:hypothetical protein